jgi:DNA repair protein RecO (recombination protein O)
MLHKTRGIVFRFTKYGETSIIVTMFTELFGLQSYIVNGVRSKTSKNKIALYQPLTLLDLVVYHREQANINRIKEIKCLYPYQTIPIDIKKSSLAIFILEIINKTIKEESHTQELCEFLIHSFIKLDQMPGKTGHFHLIFLLKLSRFLGFGVHHVNDVLGARVTELANEHIIDQLVKSDYADFVEMSNDQRREILDLILKFYAEHIENLGEIKSVSVLREIF